MDSVFWPTAFGAALGVVAGVFIQFLCETFMSRFTDRKIRKSLKKEYEYNLLVLDAVGQSFRSFRDAMNGGALGNFVVYIPCNEGLHMQSGSLAQTGRIYDFFSTKQLKQLWAVHQFLSASNGQWYHAQLEQRKQSIASGPTAQIFTEAVSFLGFCDRTVAERKADIQGLIDDFR